MSAGRETGELKLKGRNQRKSRIAGKGRECDSLCPVDRTLSVVGDRWTLLILRELTFGVHRFDEIQAQTGMSSLLLSTRLKRLEKEGIVEKRLYNQHPPRFEYHKTGKGKGLDIVMLALRSWGLRFGRYRSNQEPAVKFVHKRTGRPIGIEWSPPAGAKPFTFDDADATLSKAYVAERDARRATFFARKRGD